MTKKPNTKVVLIETHEGPIEFQVRVKEDGGLTWNAGRYLLRDKRVFISLPFATRISDAIRLINEQEKMDG